MQITRRPLGDKLNTNTLGSFIILGYANKPPIITAKSPYIGLKQGQNKPRDWPGAAIDSL